MHWNKLEWVDPKSTPKIVKAYSVSSNFSILIITIELLIFLVILNLLHWILLIFIKKQINERMETEMKEMDEKLGINAFSEDDNFDEAIPLQIRKERTTEA